MRRLSLTSPSCITAASASIAARPDRGGRRHMLQEQRITGDRRTRSSNLIRKLVDARTDMLALYGDLIGKRPFVSDPSVPTTLQRFCQSLVDYTAQAHFQ